MFMCRETLAPRGLPSIANIEKMLACDKIAREIMKTEKGLERSAFS